MPQPAQKETLERGTMLDGRYRIEREIGSGGYASVYKAIDTTYNVERAIKEVTDPDKGVREQFRLEADLLINHTHPNIPRGYKVIEVNKRIYFVMDFVEGKDLEELLNESLTQQHRPLEEGRVLRWAIAICGALTQLHRLPKPIIHRDIKPANIKIAPDDRPVLIDFGLAKVQQQGAVHTQVAAQGVSPGFAPPEQYMAKGRTDARTDVYGLGATLYACLTGRDPAEAPARLLAQTGVTHGSTLDDPRKLNPRISPRTEAVILKSLELSPSKRQQSTAELEQELRDALNQLNGASAPGATMVMPQSVASQVNQQSARHAAVAAPVAPVPQAPRQPVVAANVPQAGKPAPMPRGTAKQPTPIGNPVGGVNQRTGRQAAVTPAAASVAAVAAPTAFAAAPATANRPAPAPALTETGQHRTLLDALPGSLGRSSGKHPVAQTTAPQPAAHAAPQPGQPAQPLVGTSSAQRPVLQFQGATGATPAMAGAATALAEKDQKSGKQRVVQKAPVAAPPVDPRSWIHLGTTPISRFGKWMLALSAIEALWGAVALSLGILSIVNSGLPTSLLTKLGLGWLVVVAILSLLGGQALSRPIYRRGRLGNVRRAMQGTGLFVFSVVVHLVALWGATIFISTPGNQVLAVIAYIIFGLNVLVVGALSVYNILD